MSDPKLIKIIADCMCRSDGLEPDDCMLVYDERGQRVLAREWYETCAGILIETLGRNGYRIEMAG